MTIQLAYHFLRSDMTSGEGHEPPWTVGDVRTLSEVCDIVPCVYGYHGSPTPWDALPYAPGSMLCLVELSGDLVTHGEPTDKWAARMRKLVGAVNIERELRLFAADCAERVLYLFERERPANHRPHQAIVAARQFANGETTYAAMAAAEDAARYATGTAAEAAAGAAARYAAGAAAEAAAGAAARYAAEAAAEAAAKAAAKAAARAATYASEAAAWAAEREWQCERFNVMAYAALGAQR